MSRQTKILLTAIFGNVLLGLLFAYQRFTPYKETASNIEHFLLAILGTFALIIVPAFILGLISWTILKRTKSDGLSYFITFNTIGLAFLLIVNLNKAYQTWHYNKYQANIDYNKSLTKQGGYLDTCMMLVQNKIRDKGIKPNDFRILSYGYDVALTTIPRDSTNRLYNFEVIYADYSTKQDKFRVAKYLLNFSKEIREIYDVASRDKRAIEQIKNLKGDLLKAKDILKEIPDSAEQDLQMMKEKLESVQ